MPKFSCVWEWDLCYLIKHNNLQLLTFVCCMTSAAYRGFRALVVHCASGDTCMWLSAHGCASEVFICCLYTCECYTIFATVQYPCHDCCCHWCLLLHNFARPGPIAAIFSITYNTTAVCWLKNTKVQLFLLCMCESVPFLLVWNGVTCDDCFVFTMTMAVSFVCILSFLNRFICDCIIIYMYIY